MKKKLMLILFILVLLATTGCSTLREKAPFFTPYQNSKHYAGQLKQELDEFETKRGNLQQKITTAVAKVEENPSKKEALLDDWDQALKEYQTLKEQYDKVGNKSQQFFNQLSKLEKKIKNPELRKKVKQKNYQLQQRYTEEFEKAGSILTKIKKVLDKGEDLTILIKIEEVRGKLNNNIDKLVNIQQEAQRLLAQLEELKKMGDEMITSSNG